MPVSVKKESKAGYQTSTFSRTPLSPNSHIPNGSYKRSLTGIRSIRKTVQKVYNSGPIKWFSLNHVLHWLISVIRYYCPVPVPLSWSTVLNHAGWVRVGCDERCGSSWLCFFWVNWSWSLPFYSFQVLCKKSHYRLPGSIYYYHNTKQLSKTLFFR